MFGRRLATVVSAVVVALGATAMAATPAQAWDPNCSIGIVHYEQAGGYITGFKFKYCDHKPDQPLYVTVERYMSPGVYQTVASEWARPPTTAEGSPTAFSGPVPRATSPSCAHKALTAGNPVGAATVTATPTARELTGPHRSRLTSVLNRW